MEHCNIERVGSQFDLKLMINHQQRIKAMVKSWSQQIRSGMTESDAVNIWQQMTSDHKIEKQWHPLKVRFGKNSTKSFREKSEPYVLQENDIFFIDVGAVIDNHETDYGETFVLGNNENLSNLANASQEIFYDLKRFWREENLTGEELYTKGSDLAQKKNLIFNQKMQGHRIGDFPHALHYKGSLGQVSIVPKANLWVLEVHVIDNNQRRGAFFEDLLY